MWADINNILLLKIKNNIEMIEYLSEQNDEIKRIIECGIQAQHTGESINTCKSSRPE